MGFDARDLCTNLRFADDILLIGRSLSQVRSMLEDLITEAKKYGLEVHAEKTKVVTNKVPTGTNYMEVLGQKFEILSDTASTNYLGREVNLHEPGQTEIENRMKSAWAKFAKFKFSCSFVKFTVSCYITVSQYPLYTH